MKIKWLILVIISVISLFSSFWLGAFDLYPLNFLDGSMSTTESYVFKGIRLPRVLSGFIIGATLAGCGSLLQGLFRNPLADPSIIGISSGAAAFAVLTIIFGGALSIENTLYSEFALPISAFIGAVLVAFFTHMIAVQRGETSLGLLLLAGIAFQFIGMAVTGICMFLSTDEQLRSINFWMMGSLGQLKWFHFTLFSVALLPLIVLSRKLNTELNAMSFGESHAKAMGVNTKRTKYWIILTTTFAVGVSVAFCGIIGFIGLVGPHLARLLFGENNKLSYPASLLIGGTLVVLSDSLARTILAPQEIPIGILTSAIGAPALLSLLFKQRKKLMAQ